MKKPTTRRPTKRVQRRVLLPIQCPLRKRCDKQVLLVGSMVRLFAWMCGGSGGTLVGSIGSHGLFFVFVTLPPYAHSLHGVTIDRKEGVVKGFKQKSGS